MASGRLQVPRQRSRRRVSIGRPTRLPPAGIGDIWAYDVVNTPYERPAAQVSDGLRRVQAGVAGDRRGGRRSIGGHISPDQLIRVHATPRYLPSDNGPDFVSRAIVRWLGQANIGTARPYWGSAGRMLLGSALLANSETSV